jgi:group I intron endonuclease
MIWNRVNNKRYVGSAVNLESRWTVHKWGLRHNKHHCIHLQRSWNKYGEDAFEFKVLRFCEASKLRQVEQLFLDMLSKSLLMNSAPLATGNLGFKHSEETKSKMRKAAKTVSNTTEQKSLRSERALRQHSEGRLKRPRKPRYKSCKDCGEKFELMRLANDMISQTNYCDKCRPPHKGGYYKHNTKV